MTIQIIALLVPDINSDRSILGMKFPVPRGKPADTLLNRGRRPEADVTHQVVDIGLGLGHLADCIGASSIFA